MDKTTCSWRVEWITTNHQKEWKPFCRYKDYPSEALYSYEEALKRPGCIEARIVERITTVTELVNIVTPEHLQGRV